mgnify:CR=1 FL=1
MKKEVILVTGSSSWWKSKKFRKESFEELRTLRKKKWKMKKMCKLFKESYSIDTKSYKKYYLYK